MRQGATWPHKFKLPFSTGLVKTVQVVYAQSDNIVYRKKTSDCSMSGPYVSLVLSQTETLSLDPKKSLQMQLRLVTTDGNAFATSIFITNVDPSLDKEVLT